MRYLLLATVLMMISCGTGSSSTTAQKPASTSTKYLYRVVQSIPHSRTAYTQGLYIDNGELYEGTGLYGSSSLRRIELATNKTLKQIDLSEEFFGEGIALHQGAIYQLTWEQGKAFVYDRETFALKATRSYAGQGWGLASDGEKLYMSDGTHKIYTINPESFEQLSTLEVRLDGIAVVGINEMEWIEGEIWANIYGSEALIIIDPKSGVVRGVVNLSGLLPQSQRDSSTDVLNGIAYDNQNKKIYVTGKNWPYIYQIELIEQ